MFCCSYVNMHGNLLYSIHLTDVCRCVLMCFSFPACFVVTSLTVLAVVIAVVAMAVQQVV